MTVFPRDPQPVPVLKAYMERHGMALSALRPDGSLKLQVDTQYRVELRPVGAGQLAMVSALVRLSGLPAASRDAFLARLLWVSAGLVREHVCGLAIDPSRQRLELQQRLPHRLDVRGLEDALADFVNALAMWCWVCRQEAPRWFDVPLEIG